MIASAVQRGSFIVLYDVRGMSMGTIPAGTRQGDGLVGYTSSTVSVRKGGFIVVYDDRGRQLSAVPAGR